MRKGVGASEAFGEKNAEQVRRYQKAGWKKNQAAGYPSGGGDKPGGKTLGGWYEGLSTLKGRLQN